LAGLRWQDRHWDGHLAHQYVRRAIARGDLVPQPCEECGEAVTVGHHDDYAKVLEVRWLCDSHHRRWHLAHPVDYEVPGPPKKAAAPATRIPNRGRKFRQYLKPRALRLRKDGGYSYQYIADELGISNGTAYKWINNPEYR